MQPLSVYVLTFNSEKYLDTVLGQAGKMADDLLVVDSGSQDSTLQIAERHGARVLHRPLDDFAAQRNCALDNCLHDWTFAIDSDEIADDELIETVRALKAADFGAQPEQALAYRPTRKWLVMGREIHCLLPIRCPDYPPRIFQRSKVRYLQDNLVHESPQGWTDWIKIKGCLIHRTYETRTELFGKLERYTDLAAREMRRRSRKKTLLKQVFSPPAAWFKFYIRLAGWKDGRVGWILAWYAFRYTWLKYRKL